MLRSFSQAVKYVFSLREAAITAQRAQDFNRLVGKLALEEDGRAVVVELVTQRGGLIKGDEAAGGVSDTEAEQFRSKFAENKKVGPMGESPRRLNDQDAIRFHPPPAL